MRPKHPFPTHYSFPRIATLDTFGPLLITHGLERGGRSADLGGYVKLDLDNIAVSHIIQTLRTRWGTPVCTFKRLAKIKIRCRALFGRITATALLYTMIRFLLMHPVKKSRAPFILNALGV